MASIITGLFKSQSQAAAITKDLDDSGFEQNNYILYLHEKPISKEVKTSLWQSFFGDNTKLENDSLVVSVKVPGPNSRERVTEIFQNNQCVYQNYVENIKFQDAKSLQMLKRIVSLRAKAHIFDIPANKRREQHNGMNSEVFFG